MSLTLTSTDEEVIKACRTYLRGACGDSLDSMQGSNYQVIIWYVIFRLTFIRL